MGLQRTYSMAASALVSVMSLFFLVPAQMATLYDNDDAAEGGSLSRPRMTFSVWDLEQCLYGTCTSRSLTKGLCEATENRFRALQSFAVLSCLACTLLLLWSLAVFLFRLTRTTRTEDAIAIVNRQYAIDGVDRRWGRDTAAAAATAPPEQRPDGTPVRRQAARRADRDNDEPTAAQDTEMVARPQHPDTAIPVDRHPRAGAPNNNDGEADADRRRRRRDDEEVREGDDDNFTDVAAIAGGARQGDRQRERRAQQQALLLDLPPLQRDTTSTRWMHVYSASVGLVRYVPLLGTMRRRGFDVFAVYMLVWFVWLFELVFWVLAASYRATSKCSRAELNDHELGRAFGLMLTPWIIVTVVFLPLFIFLRRKEGLDEQERAKVREELMDAVADGRVRGFEHGIRNIIDLDDRPAGLVLDPGATPLPVDEAPTMRETARDAQRREEQERAPGSAAALAFPPPQTERARLHRPSLDYSDASSDDAPGPKLCGLGLRAPSVEMRRVPQPVSTISFDPPSASRRTNAPQSKAQDAEHFDDEAPVDAAHRPARTPPPPPRPSQVYMPQKAPAPTPPALNVISVDPSASVTVAPDVDHVDIADLRSESRSQRTPTGEPPSPRHVTKEAAAGPPAAYSIVPAPAAAVAAGGGPSANTTGGGQRSHGDSNDGSRRQSSRAAEHTNPFVTKSREDAEPQCVVCMSRPPTHVCIPCGHYVMCGDCVETMAGQSNICPLCRETVSNMMRVYR